MTAARRTAVLMIVCSIITAPPGLAQSPGGADPAPGAPFQRGTWLLTMSGSVSVEAWNYNTSREELYMFTSGLRYEASRRLALNVEALTAYVSQRGTDAFAVGWLGGIRWRIHGRSRRTLSLDLDVGMTRAELRVPPGGTRFNYLFRPGATATLPLWRGSYASTAITWLHLSNNSLDGRNRNPDIQAVGITAGVLLPF